MARSLYKLFYGCLAVEAALLLTVMCLAYCLGAVLNGAHAFQICAVVGVLIAGPIARSGMRALSEYSLRPSDFTALEEKVAFAFCFVASAFMLGAALVAERPQPLPAALLLWPVVSGMAMCAAASLNVGKIEYCDRGRSDFYRCFVVLLAGPVICVAVLIHISVLAA